tara:strand:+ start:217 stop:924 length:708 start_codon:yes stop_codon:yes gene_type:complete
MEKLVEHFSNSFSEMGSTLTFVAIIIILFMVIFKNSLSQVIAKIKLGGTERAKSKKRVKDLWSHDLFITVGLVKKKVNAIDFTTHGEVDTIKSKLLKRLISNQLESFSERVRGFINKDCIDSFDGQKLKFLITEVLRTGTVEYNQKTKNEFLEMGISKDDADFLIDRYGNFRDEVQEGFFDRIDSITTNVNYSNNYDRLSAVFEVLAMGLYLIPKDSISACNNINGRFSKYSKED